MCCGLWLLIPASLCECPGLQVPVLADSGLIDARAGSLTFSGTMSVPEPTMATLSLLALAGLAARRRRQ